MRMILANLKRIVPFCKLEYIFVLFFIFYFSETKVCFVCHKKSKKCFQVQKERIKFHSWVLNTKTKSFFLKIRPESEF